MNENEEREEKKRTNEQKGEGKGLKGYRYNVHYLYDRKKIHIYADAEMLTVAAATLLTIVYAVIKRRLN